jgi:hypothetical protein
MRRVLSETLMLLRGTYERKPRCVGNVWEMCGKYVGNVWEMCGKCVGNVWDDDLPSRALVGYSREADSANVYDSQEKKTMFLIHLQQELC